VRRRRGLSVGQARELVESDLIVLPRMYVLYVSKVLLPTCLDFALPEPRFARP